nr:flavodoxin family protein [Acholeplasmatales bacterium]
MRPLIAYFSATGNTKKCVMEYINLFKKNNIDYYLHNIEDGKIDSNIEFDTLIIAYPIHGFNAPENVLDFAKSLKKEENKKRLIILKTSGEPLRINNVSSYSLRRILKRRNYYLTNEYHYVMPYDIIFRHTDLMA